MRLCRYRVQEAQLMLQGPIGEYQIFLNLSNLLGLNFEEEVVIQYTSKQSLVQVISCLYLLLQYC